MPATMFRRRETAAPPQGRIGIIDIGSNSIRLVVYEGPARVPAILFNEKVLAGLGKGLAKSGTIEPEAMERADAALARFVGLARAMEVGRLRTVATAAVRDASNGALFLQRLKRLGIEPELLSGDEEAATAGYGVLAGIPHADGVVGDLGGGSLELIRVAGGAIHERLSLPLGVLRLGAIREQGRGALDKAVGHALEAAGWSAGEGKPFYLVGGSWRALARLDMHLTEWPLPIMHHYRMPVDEAARLVRVLAHMDKKRLREVPGLSAGRLSTLPEAAAMLSVVVRRLRSSGMIVSAYGLREGLLHRSLPPAVQAEDPLLAAMRDEGARAGRFPEHGDLLADWIAPLFGDEGAEETRLRHAACLLSDVAWRAHPEFRAIRGMETALHGNWVGIDARGRAMVARALWTHFGNGGSVPLLDRLATPEDLARADRWGLAMRLGQRLSGGVASGLEASAIALTPQAVTLTLGGDEGLWGEAVERRLKALATAFGRKGEVAGGRG
ncbi:Ppx/GppA family phosphatase [Sphingomonas jatrophae]|uniref:Exopolyphosphatase / guanosine-5'-triphosphate,3'-diphosphate pyrophosphatase n=1 Tax=Sphingomonas jatrophae TaxID=1166337 RepID=A0A1I6L4X2_9SPHN|nr:Ppx/GppA family phosphatase [Sphingomonas jatrophae]SFR98525.1 exopolyphosphatase / guanosine-5'-triphosphate,3'-diphosphate pyrophosphatase [Sphingomonas jatrophae]